MADAAPPRDLALADQLLLLALDGERGTRSRSTELEPGLGGAVVMDLALRRRIDVADKRVVVIDPAPTGDAVLDGVLARIAASPRPRSAKHWVVRAKGGVRDAVADRLVASGALRRERTRVLGLFPLTRFPTADPAPEARVRARLDDAVLRGAAPDERTAALAALVHAVGLQRAVFGAQEREERRATKRRLAELAEGDWAADAVRRAIRDITAATASSATYGGDGGGGGDGGSS